MIPPVSVKNMAHNTTLTFRLDQDTKDRLELLARSTHRSKSFLAAEAVRQYMEAHAWQVAEIQKAVERADSGGHFVSHEQMIDWLETWGTDRESSVPDAASR